jgi:hypothetical protein
MRYIAERQLNAVALTMVKGRAKQPVLSLLTKP